MLHVSLLSLVNSPLVCALLSLGAQTIDNSTEPSGAVAPDGSLFYEEYVVREKVKYLLPEEASIKEMTEWDWIEMQPHEEMRRHKSSIDYQYRRSLSIDILESDLGNTWDYKVSHLSVDAEKSRLYDRDSKVISNLPHSKSYLKMEEEFSREIRENGLNPLKPFIHYEQLPLEKIQSESFTVEHGEKSAYTLRSSYEQIYINPETNTCTHHVLKPSTGQPFYTRKQYKVSSQGYLLPVFEEIKTRIRSEKGQEVIQVKTRSYPEYTAYYDPSVVLQPAEKPFLFRVYPNPVKDYLQLSYEGPSPADTYQVTIMNKMNEQVIKPRLIDPKRIQKIDLSHLPTGFYIIQFQTKQNTFTQKIFKK